MERRKPKRFNPRVMPGHPPEDYKGSVADWIITLQELGLWDGKEPEWYGDLKLTVTEYQRILKHTEGK